MSPQIEGFYSLPNWPRSVASHTTQGADCLLIGCSSVSQIYRIDLALGTCEPFFIEGISDITDIAVAPAGGCYLVDAHRSLLRLDDRMALVASVTETDGAIKAIEAIGNGFVAVLARPTNRNLPADDNNRVQHSLVRYSDALEKLWSIDLGEDLVSSRAFPSKHYPPVIPAVSQEAGRFRVVAALDRIVILQVEADSGAVVVQEIPRSADHIVHGDKEFWRVEERIYPGDKESAKRGPQWLPVFLDACSHPSADGLILVEWGSFRTQSKAEATGFYDCRYDEHLGRYNTRFSVIEGSFLWITALPGDRVAALGRLTFGGERGVAVIKLPTINHTTP